MKVAHEHYRPKLPSFCPESYRILIEDCWKQNPDERPDFTEILERLFIIKRINEKRASIEQQDSNLVHNINLLSKQSQTRKAE